MFIDLNSQKPPDLEFDLCLIGAGPAGITIAKYFIDKPFKILLLEGGDFEYSDESHSLLECLSTGLDAWPQFTRQRFFGGTSNHWAGRCRPFENSDFYQKSYGSLPGWPIRYSEIEPYLKETMSILDLPSEGFVAESSIKLDTRFISDAYAKSPPTRFGQKYRKLIDSSANISCILNANAIGLELGGAQSNIKAIKVKNYLGEIDAIKAKHFVLAMGAIGNARFLLNQKVPVGNKTGMVGKCFMEHLNVRLGEYVNDDPESGFSNQFYTSEDFKEKFSTGASNTTMSITRRIKSFGTTAKIKTFFKTIACDLSIEDKVRFLSNFTCPGTGRISTLMEQSPGMQSYVSLSDELDSLGMRKAVLNWELNSFDYRTIRTIAIELAKSFADSGLGLIKLPEYILDESLEIPIGHHAHHMGTTRMSDSYDHGVVDPNCKVFGTENLYIAGSSIFATGGACNPTMPILQFALRLANHLNSKMMN